MKDFAGAVNHASSYLSIFADEQGRLKFHSRDREAEAIHEVFKVKMKDGEIKSTDLKNLFYYAKFHYGVYVATRDIAIMKLRHNRHLEDDVRNFLADILSGTFPTPKKKKVSKVEGRNRFICAVIPIIEYRYGLKPTRSSVTHESGCDAVSQAMSKFTDAIMTYDGVVAVWKDRKNIT